MGIKSTQRGQAIGYWEPNLQVKHYKACSCGQVNPELRGLKRCECGELPQSGDSFDVASTIVGVTSEAQLEPILAASELVLPDDVMKACHAVTREFLYPMG